MWLGVWGVLAEVIDALSRYKDDDTRYSIEVGQATRGWVGIVTLYKIYAAYIAAS